MKTRAEIEKEIVRLRAKAKRLRDKAEAMEGEAYQYDRVADRLEVELEERDGKPKLPLWQVKAREILEYRWLYRLSGWSVEHLEWIADGAWCDETDMVDEVTALKQLRHIALTYRLELPAELWPPIKSEKLAA